MEIQQVMNLRLYWIIFQHAWVIELAGKVLVSFCEEQLFILKIVFFRNYNYGHRWTLTSCFFGWIIPSDLYSHFSPKFQISEVGEL